MALSLQEQLVAFRLLTRWLDLAKSGRISTDLNVIRLCVETDQFIHPVSYEPPKVTHVGNLKDLVSQVDNPDSEDE